MHGLGSAVKRRLEVVDCGPELRDAGLRLLTRLWSPDLEVNRAYWAWKYDRNPYGGEPRVYAALDGGRLVGMRGFMGARWQAGGSEASVLCAGDTVVAPEYENQGVFRTIMEVAEDDLRARGHRFLFNLSAGPAVFLRSLRMGWRSIGPYEIWRRPGTPGAASAASGDPFESLGGPGPGRTDLGDGLSVSDRPRGEEMAAMVRRAGPVGRIRHVRDATYFGWRFQNPLSRYRFVYRDEHGLDGYVVLRAGRYRSKDVVKIVDAEGAEVQRLAELLDAVVRLFGAWTLEIWAASQAPDIRARLSGAGFGEVRTVTRNRTYRRAPLVKATDASLPVDEWTLGGARLLDVESWDLRMLWSDGV